MAIHKCMYEPEISKGRNQKDYTVTVGSQHGTLGSPVFVYADTLEEAEQAKRAFENVLLPRFTRDEAIAIVTERLARDSTSMDLALGSERRKGARLALEALAAAGVFVPEPCGSCDASAGTPCVAWCGAMADKLDAAGIR